MRHPSARLFLGIAALLIGVGVTVTPAAAQLADRPEQRWHPQWGDWSLSFHVPTGGGAGFGFWKQRGEHLALGLTVDGTVAFSDGEDSLEGLSSSDLALSIRPALKRYWWRDGPVSPFLHSGLSGTYRRTDTGATSSWRFGGGLSFGIGADWFPAEGISIGGHTGLGATYLWTTSNDDLATDQTRFVLDLFTSALTFHLYF